MTETTVAPRTNLTRATAGMSAVTLVSRLTGFVRVWVVLNVLVIDRMQDWDAVATDVEAFNNGFISLTILPNDFPDAEEPTTTTTVPPSADEAPSSANEAPSAAATPLAPAFTG